MKRSAPLWHADPGYVVDAERLAVAPMPGRPGRFRVRGTDTVYTVRVARPDQEEVDTCECKGFGYRGRCAHINAVVEFARDMETDPRLWEWVKRHWWGEPICRS
jgi:hypothetical protein